MNLTVSQKDGRVPVTVIHVDGKLDTNSFKQLIEEAKKAFNGGARRLILDMTNLTYISSAGIVALHAIAKLFRGEALPDLDAGWSAIRSVEKERTSETQKNVKLLNVPPDVQNVLDVVGFTDFFEKYTDLEQAVASFR